MKLFCVYTSFKLIIPYQFLLTLFCYNIYIYKVKKKAFKINAKIEDVGLNV